MKKNFLIPAICAMMLCACGGNQQNNNAKTTDPQTVNTQTANKQTTEVSEGCPDDVIPEPEVVVDVAQNVLKLLDKKLVQFGGEYGITDAEFNAAINEKRDFSENDSPMCISVSHQSECYSSVNVNCFGMVYPKNFVFVNADEGCDAGASRYAKCFIYDEEANTLTETENPIKFPDFSEFTKGADLVGLASSINELKRNHKSNKELGGLDFRFNDSRDLEIRPGGTYSNEVWDALKPVVYKFNGTTLQKVE